MSIISVAAVGIISALLSLTVKKYNPEMAILISLGAGALILIMLLDNIVPIIQIVSRLVDEIGISSDYIKILLKCLGIAILTQFAADACKDAGEQMLCSQVELAGKVMMLITAMPLLLKLIETALEIMKQ